MRRLTRYLFTFCSAVSLLLCVAVCVLWVRSYSYCDYWQASEEGKCRIRYLVSDSGQIGHYEYSWDSGIPVPGLPLKDERWDYHRASAGAAVLPFPGKRESVWGFAWGVTRKHTLRGRFDYSGPAITVESWMPYWALATVMAVLPLLWARSRWRRSRARSRQNEGFCPACGYDLRASPERCPECGAVAGGSGA
jgi:hypothetical protein